MERLAEVIDGHRWDELQSLLDPSFTCRYVHTGATGHSAVYERMVGSRADRIVQLAPCPVLVVK